MIGIKYEMERINEEINCKLIKPLQQITQHFFDINYYALSHQILHTAQMLVDRLEANVDIKAQYQKLVKKIKESVKYRPQNQSEGELDQFDQKDEIRTFLNTRKPILETKQKQRGDLYKFLASREKKEKDNQTFLINMNKVKTMPNPIQTYYKADTKTMSMQTQISWTKDITVIPAQNSAINVELIRSQIQNWYTSLKGSETASRPKIKYEENLSMGELKSSSKKQKQKKIEFSTPSKKVIGGKSKKNIEESEQKMEDEGDQTNEQMKKSQTKRVIKQKVSKLKKSKGTSKKTIDFGDSTNFNENAIERNKGGIINRNNEKGKSVPVSSQFLEGIDKEKNFEEGSEVQKPYRNLKNANFLNQATNQVMSREEKRELNQKQGNEREVQIQSQDNDNKSKQQQKQKTNELKQVIFRQHKSLIKEGAQMKANSKENQEGNKILEQDQTSLKQKNYESATHDKAGESNKINRQGTLTEQLNKGKTSNSKIYQSPSKLQKEIKRNLQKQARLNVNQQNATAKRSNELNYNESMSNQEGGMKKKSVHNNSQTQSKISPKQRLNQSKYRLQKDKQNTLPQISNNQKTIFRQTHEKFRSTIKNIKNTNSLNHSYHVEHGKDERKSYLNYSDHQSYQREPQFEDMKTKVQQLLSKEKIGKKQMSQQQKSIIEKLQNIKQSIISNPYTFKNINQHQQNQIQVCVKMFEALHSKVCGKGCRHLERFYTNIRGLKTQGKKQLKLPIFLIDSSNIA